MLLLLQNAYDLFRGHSLLFQLQAVFYQNLFPNGGIQTVYDEDFAFIILGSDPGTLAGAGQLAGNSNHNDSFSGRYSFFVGFFEDCGRYQTGGGQSITFDQFLIEYLITDGDTVCIFLLTEADMQGENRDVLS